MTGVTLTSTNNAHSNVVMYKENTFTGLSISAVDDSSATFLIPGVAQTGSGVSFSTRLDEVRVVYYILMLETFKA